MEALRAGIGVTVDEGADGHAACAQHQAGDCNDGHNLVTVIGGGSPAAEGHSRRKLLLGVANADAHPGTPGILFTRSISGGCSGGASSCVTA